MEDIAWKKDETPYVVFPCKKCRQYIYAKITQKTKKCLRCGRSHTVNNVKESGEIVYGMSPAVELVKQRQDEFAIKELGTRPKFRTFNDFTISHSRNTKTNFEEKENGEEFKETFIKMLIDLSQKYNSFPFYIIEIMADNYGIPEAEVKFLTRSFQKQGILKRLKDYSYHVNLE